MRKSKGVYTKRLEHVLENYNNSLHRGIGISTNEALNEENYQIVKSTGEKYRKEFQSRNLDKFKVNDKVLIRSEINKDKMNKNNKESDMIIEVHDNDEYTIQTEDIKTIRRHRIQLKILSEG